MNPRYAQDWAFRQFVTNRRGEDDGDLRLENVNFDRNKWLDPAVVREAERFKELEPDRYDHVWLGELDDEEVRKVLSWDRVETCVEAWRRGLHKPQRRPLGRSWVFAGLDLAVTGWSALAIRKGPVLEHVERWRGKQGNDLKNARYAARVCEDHGVEHLFVDAGGVGSGVYSHLREIHRTFQVHPELFGAAVKGADAEVFLDMPNDKYLGRRAAQMAWGLRYAARATDLLVSGERVPKSLAFFINAEIKDLRGLMMELSQPEWEESKLTGKIEVEKSPDDLPSPDRYDATILAWANTSEYGLRRLDWRVLKAA